MGFIDLLGLNSFLILLVIVFDSCFCAKYNNNNIYWTFENHEYCV